MKSIQFLPVILLSAGLILFSSCSDNVVNSGNPSNSISGSVFDQNGNVVYPARVWLDYYPYQNVSPYGTFSFNDVRFPYDLTVGRPGSNEFIRFRNLTTHKPKVYINLNPPVTYRHQALVYMTYPVLLPRGETQVSFLSKGVKYVTNRTYQSDSSMLLTINWTGNSVISGKAALIQYKYDSNGKIISYDRFGYRDTLLSSGETIYLRILNSELQFNPSESSLTVDALGSGPIDTYEMGIAFDGFSKSSDISLFWLYGSGNPVSFLVPGSLSLEYQVYAYLHYSRNTIYILAGHGGYVYLPQYTTVNLLYPFTTDSADYNTDFIYSGGGNVCVTSFLGPGCNFSVVSTSDTVRLPILPFFGIILPAGSQFSWGVKRFNSFTNVDEFVSDKRISVSQYNTSASETGHFYLK